jgi:hypothetical protein
MLQIIIVWVIFLLLLPGCVVREVIITLDDEYWVKESFSKIINDEHNIAGLSLKDTIIVRIPRLISKIS